MERISRSSRDINVPASSLADIAFLLIIFFMVATLFNTAKGLRFDLPSNKSKPKIIPRSKLVIIDMGADGKVLIDGTATQTDQIDPRLSALRKTSKTKSLLFRVNRDCPYGKFAALASRLREAGFARFSIKGVD